MEIFSRKLYHTLDHIGYRHDMLQFRKEAWKCIAKLENKNTHKNFLYSISAGSKCEGTSSIFASDTDTMILHTCIHVNCIHTTEQLPSQLPNSLTMMFLADMDNVPPGYTRLKLHRPASLKKVRDIEVRGCLFELQDEVYLSSTSWTAMVKKKVQNYTKDNPNTTIRDVSGPAVPATTHKIFDWDIVSGFTFRCPQLLQVWASRRRQHEWPSQDIIDTACSFLPQVVPVGAKGSDRQDQEWRFCFIESELTLTNSLNGTQIKLYIFLKMIAKNSLKQVTGEISSYIMKNITYWLSELLPVRVFREEKLASLVLLALKVLRKSINEWQNLPYYMIPSRNLLLERLDSNTRSELSDVLYRLIQEGPQLFLRIEKLRIYLQTSCFNIVRFGQMRDDFEKRFIVFCIFDMFRRNDVLPCYLNLNSLMIQIIILGTIFCFTKHPIDDIVVREDLLHIFVRAFFKLI